MNNVVNLSFIPHLTAYDFSSAFVGGNLACRVISTNFCILRFGRSLPSDYQPGSQVLILEDSTRSQLEMVWLYYN